MVDIFKEETIGITAMFEGKHESTIAVKRKKLDTPQKESKNFIYIGETSRSSFEHGQEHFKDLEYKSASHIC